MAVTCGFFNGLNHDRKYFTEEISRLFDGIIRDGVYASIGDKFAVTASEGMTINVGSGRAWFNHTWTYNDTDLPIKMEDPDLVLDRYDAIILEVDASEEVRNNSIKPVKGTAASNPQKPVMVETEFVHQKPLAFIKRLHGSTEIKAEDIEIVVGKDECPYVTSVLEAASIEELFVQWDAQFGSWQDGQKAEFEAWFEGIKGQLSSDQAGNLQLQMNEKGIQLYTHSKSGTVHEFIGTGPNGRAKMTDNVVSGDTFTVNGTPVIAYMGADEAAESMDGSSYNGKWVTFVYDSEASTLNFKGGGGRVTVSGLSAGVVKQGTTVTVKQGAKTIASVVGTLPDGNAAKKIAVGERITDTHATIYATYAASNISNFASASGNGIKLNESGRYAITLIAGSAYANGKSACTLTITRPGMSTITQQKTLKVVNILWEGELPAGSVVTGVSTVSGGGTNHSITMTIVK